LVEGGISSWWVSGAAAMERRHFVGLSGTVRQR
jgi:hypothetical protein